MSTTPQSDPQPQETPPPNPQPQPPTNGIHSNQDQGLYFPPNPSSETPQIFKPFHQIQLDARIKLGQSLDYLKNLEESQKMKIMENLQHLKNVQNMVSELINDHIQLLDYRQSIDGPTHITETLSQLETDQNFFRTLQSVKRQIFTQKLAESSIIQSPETLENLKEVSKFLKYNAQQQLETLSENEKEILTDLFNQCDINAQIWKNNDQINKIASICDETHSIKNIFTKLKNIMEKQASSSETIIQIEELISHEKHSHSHDDKENNPENNNNMQAEEKEKRQILKHEDSEISQSTAFQTPQQKAEINQQGLSQLDLIRQEIGNIKIQAQQEQQKQHHFSYMIHPHQPQSQQHNININLNQSQFFKLKDQQHQQQQHQDPKDSQQILEETQSHHNLQQQQHQQQQDQQQQNQQEFPKLSQLQQNQQQMIDDIKIEEQEQAENQLINSSIQLNELQNASNNQQLLGSNQQLLLTKKIKKIYKRKCTNAFQRDKNRQILFEALLNKYEVCRKYDVSETYINNLALDCVINNDIQYKKRLEELCKNKNFRQQKWMFGQTIHQLQRKKLGKLHMCTEPPPEKVTFKYPYQPLPNSEQNFQNLQKFQQISPHSQPNLQQFAQQQSQQQQQQQQQQLRIPPTIPQQPGQQQQQTPQQQQESGMNRLIYPYGAKQAAQQLLYVQGIPRQKEEYFAHQNLQIPLLYPQNPASFQPSLIQQQVKNNPTSTTKNQEQLINVNDN